MQTKALDDYQMYGRRMFLVTAIMSTACLLGMAYLIS